MVAKSQQAFPPEIPPADLEEFFKVIGQTIREKREKEKIHLDTLAYHARLSRTTIMAMERGRAPQLVTLLSVLNVLGISFPAFFRLVDMKKPGR